MEDARWSPDRTKIAYTSTVNGNSDIYVLTTSGISRRLTAGANLDRAVQDWR